MVPMACHLRRSLKVGRHKGAVGTFWGVQGDTSSLDESFALAEGHNPSRFHLVSFPYLMLEHLFSLGSLFQAFEEGFPSVCSLATGLPFFPSLLSSPLPTCRHLRMGWHLSCCPSSSCFTEAPPPWCVWVQQAFIIRSS